MPARSSRTACSAALLLQQRKQPRRLVPFCVFTHVPTQVVMIDGSTCFDQLLSDPQVTVTDRDVQGRGAVVSLALRVIRLANSVHVRTAGEEKLDNHLISPEPGPEQCTGS